MKRMKRTGMKLGALALCACMLIGTMTACEISQAKDREAAIEAEEEVYHALPKTLSFTEDMFARAYAVGNEYIQCPVYAVVVPENAFNKLVDWSVKWGEGASRAAEPVTDYVTVVPTSDGSTDAHIRCMKGFGDDTIIVTVTTRSGRFTADCTVIYEGAPTSLSYILDGVEYENRDGVGLTESLTYNFSLNLKNPLGEVNSKYGNFEIVYMGGQGRFTMLQEYIVNGSVSSSKEIVFDLAEGKHTYTHEVLGDQQTLTIGTDTFLTASIEGNTLIVNAIKSEYSYINGNPRTGYRFSYKGTYTDPRSPGGVPENCIWSIVVRDTVSGVESLIYLDIEPNVTGVSLTNSTVVF